MELTVANVYQLLKNGDREERVAFLNDLPESSTKSMAYILIESDHPTSVIMALAPLATTYADTENPEAGATLCLATYYHSKDLFLSGDYPELALMTVSGFATSYLNALEAMSMAEDALEFIAEEEEFFDYYYFHQNELEGIDLYFENYRLIKSKQARALYSLLKYQSAYDISMNELYRGTPAADIEFDNLIRNIKEIGQGDTEVKDRSPEKVKEITEQQKTEIYKKLILALEETTKRL